MAAVQSGVPDTDHKLCPKCHAIVPAMAKVCAACGGSIPRVSQLSADEPSKPAPAMTGSVTYSWPLGGGTKVEVTFTSEPSKAQLDVMMAQLKIMRDVEPD
jgi:hypothetical protein